MSELYIFLVFRFGPVLEHVPPKTQIVSLAFLAMFALLSSCASRNNLVPDSDLHSLLNMVEKKAYVVQQFQADFHKVRKSNLFQNETRIKGRLIFQKPNRFELKLKGDVNLDIFSDGTFVALIHDGRDLEFFRAEGERDLSKFADPMMLLVNSLSNGDTSRFANLTQRKQHDATVLEIDPGALNEFEAVKNVKVKFSDQGAIKLIEIMFQNGNTESTCFDNWSLLAKDDPKIGLMNQSIEKLSKIAISDRSGSILQVNLEDILTASIIAGAENSPQLKDTNLGIK